MDTDKFIEQLATILDEFEDLKYLGIHDLSNIELESITKLITKSKAAVFRVSGKHSDYSSEVDKILNKPSLKLSTRLRQLIGCVQALKDDLENGYNKYLFEIIHADVFADYLEMAKYLLIEGYKDAAAVIIGSTLESHLKLLCSKHGVPIDIENSKGKLIAKKTSVINSDLRKSMVYGTAVEKQIIAWLDIRNSAAHGNYNGYSLEQVNLMSAGIGNFITQYPA